MKQDLFDPKKDNKELMIADYYTAPTLPSVPEEEPVLQNLITFYGEPVVKVGGGYKSFSVTEWKDSYRWEIAGLNQEQYTVIQSNNSIKIKIISDYTLIGKVLTLSLFDNQSKISELEIGVVSL